jgi:hypothetical protein
MAHTVYIYVYYLITHPSIFLGMYGSVWIWCCTTNLSNVRGTVAFPTRLANQSQIRAPLWGSGSTQSNYLSFCPVYRVEHCLLTRAADPMKPSSPAQTQSTADLDWRTSNSVTIARGLSRGDPNGKAMSELHTDSYILDIPYVDSRKREVALCQGQPTIWKDLLTSGGPKQACDAMGRVGD